MLIACVDGKRPKGILQWVPSNGVVFEARIYNHLFTVPEVTKDWEAELNHESEIVKTNAMVGLKRLHAFSPLTMCRSRLIQAS